MTDESADCRVYMYALPYGAKVLVRGGKSCRPAHTSCWVQLMVVLGSRLAVAKVMCVVAASGVDSPSRRRVHIVR
jgi:hypothetical protein